MARVEFNLSTVRIRKEIRELGPKIEKRVDATMIYGAAKGVEYMKLNAPWTDRTTNARNGLHTTPAVAGKTKTITFSHTMNYGIWLEVANNGKYQIIMPSVLHIGKKVMKSLNNTLGDMPNPRGGNR